MVTWCPHRSVLFHCYNVSPVADPGFPRGGGANSPGGRQHTILPNFPKKVHEIERIWTPGGGEGRVPCTPLRSATGQTQRKSLKNYDITYNDYTNDGKLPPVIPSITGVPTLFSQSFPIS